MELTPEQAKTLRDAVRRRANYFHAVKVRMNALGVGPGDSLHDLFDLVEKTVNGLVLELHNRTHHAMRPLTSRLTQEAQAALDRLRK